MPNVSLTPKLERFAEECVRSGHYGNVSEVTRAALRLLQGTERNQEWRVFPAMLNAAEAEAHAKGTVTVEELSAELDAIIEEGQGNPE